MWKLDCEFTIDVDTFQLYNEAGRVETQERSTTPTGRRISPIKGLD